MNQDARDLWTRAVRSHTTSAKLAEENPDSAASRAYYAAFYAVSAWFALQGKTFTKHQALKAAVHRNLVKPGTWATDLGADFSWLARLRRTGDYGGTKHVSPDEAREAVAKASRILQTVRDTSPELFSQIEDEE